LVVQARNPKIQPGQAGYLKVASHIKDMLDVASGKLDRSMGDIHAGGNPHYYYDPIRMNGLLPVIAQRLSSLDPNHKEIYNQNLAKAQAQFSEHITRWKAEFTALTASQRRVISYHKSLNYLFQTVGIEVVAYLEPKPGVAPTPSHVAQVLGIMKRDKIRAIVQEQYYPSATSKTLARLVSGRVVLLAAGTKSDQTYLAHIQELITPLLTALKGGQ
jgi:zinc/manganese transport system substrate-binding protein